MRNFHLVRHVDDSGVSGTGRVADGVEFEDGQCVLSWNSHIHSVCIYPSIEDLVEVHGHAGHTTVEFEKEDQTLPAIVVYNETPQGLVALDIKDLKSMGDHVGVIV